MTEVKSDNDVISKITSFLPLLTVMVLIFGVINLIIYYGFFGVNILSYLEISEILPLILKDFLFTIAGLVIGTFAGYLSPDKKQIEQRNNSIAKAKETTGSLKRLYYYAKAYPIIFVFIIGLFINAITYFFIKHNKESLISLSILQCVFIAAFIIPELIEVKLYRNRSIQINQTVKNLILVLIVLVGWGIYKGVEKYFAVKYRHKFTGTTIIINGVKIISNDKYYFIGRTKSTIFFYNSVNNYTDIMPTTNLTKVSIIEE